MKRIWIYGILLAAAVFAPPEGSDLGKLHPVETVSLYIEDGRIVLETDTGAKGKGGTVEQALQNMKDTTAGIVFLDTADYLLVRKETEELIPEMGTHLKGSTRLCRTQAAVKVEEAAAFLAVHAPQVKLAEWDGTAKLSTLEISEGRLHLNEK